MSAMQECVEAHWRSIRRAIARAIAVAVFTATMLSLRTCCAAWSYLALTLAIVATLLGAVGIFWIADIAFMRFASGLERMRQRRR